LPAFFLQILCQIRDEEALRQQEERRKANQITETSTRMRGTTLANSDASTFRSEHKRKREVSEKEKEKSEAKKQARRDEENAIAQQLDVVKEEKARQAEARLKYLLSQSDIFAHFGKKGTSLAEYKDAGESGGRSHHKIATAEDLDEDEKAMAKEIGDDDNDEGDADEPHHTILLKQPRLITGGDLR
jgi:SWI/SNF-related matrix-associated actin-dependent regulator of chromatin subfamily A member 5